MSGDQLLDCYTAADAQVFPLVEIPGDVEGFGMIAILSGEGPDRGSCMNHARKYSWAEINGKLRTQIQEIC